VSNLIGGHHAGGEEMGDKDIGCKKEDDGRNLKEKELNA
jgi:hypothetical protein